MYFEKFLKDDMDEVTKKIEAGLENREKSASLATDELAIMVRTIVKEELALAVKDIKKSIDKLGKGNINSNAGNYVAQATVSGNIVCPKIELSQTVTYDIRKEASSGMTCGGWTFFVNKKEGYHLWAVNEDGSKYYELYPKTIWSVDKIEEGYVYFRDYELKKFRLCISSGKVIKM